MAIRPLPASSDWSARDRVVAAVVVTYLALQLIVPAVLLFFPRPQRFGWQMFTAAPVIPRLVLHRTTGRRDTVDINRYFAVRRPELAQGTYQVFARVGTKVSGPATLVVTA